MKTQSRFFAALIAMTIMAAPVAANAGNKHRGAEPGRVAPGRFAAPRFTASRKMPVAPRFAAPRAAQRNYAPTPINQRNQAVWNRGNWQRNQAEEREENNYANQPSGYYNGYNGYNNYAPAPPPIPSYAPSGDGDDAPAYYQPSYGYAQPGYGSYGAMGHPALMAYRGRLLAQKASILAQLNGSANFMEHPYLRQQLAEVNKKLGEVNLKLGIGGGGYAMGQYGYNGYQQASPLAALTGLGGYNGYNGYSANPYYGQQGAVASMLPMLGNYIH